MTPQEKKIAKLEKLLASMDENLTKEDFVSAFDNVVKRIKGFETRTAQELDAIQSVLANYARQIKEDSTSDTQEIRREVNRAVETQITKLQKEHDARLAAIDAKVDSKLADVQDGDDADEDVIISRLKAELEGPITENITQQLPALGVSVRDGLELLQGDERLDKSAIKGLDEEINQLRREMDKPATGWGAHPITIQQSGVTKTKNARVINFTGATVTQSASGVTTVAISAGAASVHTETPSGLIDGANKVYTILNSVTTVIGFWINGQFIHPAEYTAIGTTITFSTALDSSLSGLGFTISYV